VKTCYVIRNRKTGKYYRGDDKWGKLHPLDVLIFKSKDEAQTWIDDPAYTCFARVYKRLEAVPVQLLRL